MRMRIVVYTAIIKNLNLRNDEITAVNIHELTHTLQAYLEKRTAQKFSLSLYDKFI